MLTAKYNRTVNVSEERIQWDLWGLWIERTSLPLQAPSGELNLLMQRKALGLLLLQPSVVRETLLSPYPSATQGALRSTHPCQLCLSLLGRENC